MRADKRYVIVRFPACRWRIKARTEGTSVDGTYAAVGLGALATRDVRLKSPLQLVSRRIKPIGASSAIRLSPSLLLSSVHDEVLRI